MIQELRNHDRIQHGLNQCFGSQVRMQILIQAFLLLKKSDLLHFFSLFLRLFYLEVEKISGRKKFQNTYKFCQFQSYQIWTWILHKYLFPSGPPLPYGVVARLGDDKLVVLEGLQSSLLPRSAQQNNLQLLYSQYISLTSEENQKLL